MSKTLLSQRFFAAPSLQLAPQLLGKVLRHKVGEHWLSARIIETEAYELSDRASHSSLGYTAARKPMFMAPGTIYMYYARGGDSLNFSALGEGNAVLIKSAVPVVDATSRTSSLDVMHQLNPVNGRRRHDHKLCSGQTLLCRSLGLRVPIWNGRRLDPAQFYLEDDGYQLQQMVQCRRLGIPTGRDEHLPYRFLDRDFVRSCTKNPLSGRSAAEGNYRLHTINAR
jgi:DNA-3-methyladenine glycosylase